MEHQFHERTLWAAVEAAGNQGAPVARPGMQVMRKLEIQQP